MIGEYTLEKLCNEYGIDFKKIINNNQNVLTYGEYFDIKMVLEYLINELEISVRNIEKCPSILYFNVYAIKHNYEFLRKKEFNIENIESCLHILSADPLELEETYNYVNNNYGEKYLKRITSILGINISRIKEIEKNFNLILEKEVILSACISDKDTIEIKQIIELCKEYNIEISGSIFRSTANEIKEIIKVCRENNIEITGSVFLKTANEIKEIIKVCRENEIKISGSVFYKTANEIKEIIKVCRENKIKITGSVFNRTARQLEENINYIKNNFGKEYLVNSIVNKNINNLKQTLPYLQELGVLSVVINSVSILTLKLDEIKERQKYIEDNGYSMVLDNKFNSIFGLSKKNYKKLVENNKKR